MDGDEPDLYVAPAALVKDLAAGGTPVIACGPAGLLRTAFLDGCDDYLRDPWTPEELGLRALAVLARGARRCRFPWGEISLEGQRLCTPGGTVPLTFHQTRILAALLRARGRPVPRAALAHAMGRAPGASGGPGAPRAPGRPMSRAIDVHVAALRRCMRAAVPASGRFIVCVRGQGYMVP
jgi:DNA-binding response OmpR family regulator